MELSEKEFLSLSSQMSDRDVKIAALENRAIQLERDLLVERAETEKWRQKYETLAIQQEAVELENQLLRNYLWLSWTKVKTFISHVKDISLIGFLQTFMQKTVSDNMGPQALVAINEAVALPEEKSGPNITNNFNAPVGQQFSHADHVTGKPDKEDPKDE